MIFIQRVNNQIFTVRINLLKLEKNDYMNNIQELRNIKNEQYHIEFLFLSNQMTEKKMLIFRFSSLQSMIKI